MANWWKRWRRVVGWIAIGLAALCVFLYFYPSAPDTRATQSLVRVVELKPLNVRIEAFLKSNHLEDRTTPDTLSVRVDNDGQSPLTRLSFFVDSPKFAMGEARWNCAGASVAPNSSCEYVVPLTAATGSGSYGINIQVDWQQRTGATVTHRRAFLNVGPVVFDDAWSAARFNRMARRLSSLLKDLTLPILLAVLGAWFQKADKEETERKQVQLLLNTKVMELAEQHYLLFVSESRLLLLEADKIHNRLPGFDPEKLFFHFLLLLKRMEVFRDTKGGIFFKTRAGERVAGTSWLLFRSRTYKTLGEANVTAGLSTVEITWKYATYLQQSSGLVNLRAQLEQWMSVPAGSGTSFWDILDVLDAFQAVMSFEADRILSKTWYEEDSKMEFLRGTQTTLYELRSDEQYLKSKTAELKTQLEAAYNRPVVIVNR